MTSLSPVPIERLARIGSRITPVVRLVKRPSQSLIAKYSVPQCEEGQCASFTVLRPLSQSSSSLSSPTHQWLSRHRSAQQGVPYPASRHILAPCEKAAWGSWAAKRCRDPRITARTPQKDCGSVLFSFFFRMEGRVLGCLLLNEMLHLEG